jgi:hypothetical protein
MSDEQQQFGQAGVEASQGFSPMPDPAPSSAGEEISIRDAADQLANDRWAREGNRPEAREPESVDYLDRDGSKANPRQTITAERGAEDLHAWREQKLRDLQQREKLGDQAAIDALRGTDPLLNNQQQQGQQQGQQQQYAPQEPQQSYQQRGAVSAEVMSRDEVLNLKPALEQWVAKYNSAAQDITNKIAQSKAAGGDGSEWHQAVQNLAQQADQIQYAQRFHQSIAQGVDPKIASRLADNMTMTLINNIADQQVQQTAQYTQHLNNENAANVQAMISSMFVNFPEMKHCRTPNDAALVINTVAKTHPQRAQAIQQHINTLQLAQQQQARYQQALQQQQAQQMNRWAEQQDAAFLARNPDLIAINDRTMATFQAAELLTKEYGIDRQTASYLYNNNPYFRSAGFQQLLMDALRYHRARGGSKEKRSNPVSKVMKPGSYGEVSRGNPEQKMPESMGFREAAQHLIARRARR